MGNLSRTHEEIEPVTIFCPLCFPFTLLSLVLPLFLSPPLSFAILIYFPPLRAIKWRRSLLRSPSLSHFSLIPDVLLRR